MPSHPQTETLNKVKKDRNSEPVTSRLNKNLSIGSRSAGNSPIGNSPATRCSLTLPKLRSQSTSCGLTSPTPNSPTTPVSSLDLDKSLKDTKQTPGKKPLPPKQRCPCKTSSNGKSWLMTCTSCQQVWHNRCANLKGDKLTKEAIDSILKDWQCPWCYVPSFPCPKNHKAAKAKASLQEIAKANEFLTAVVDSLDTMVDTKLTAVLQANTSSIEAISKQLATLSRDVSEFKNSPVLSNPPPLIHLPAPPAASIPHQPEPIHVEETSLVHNTNYMDNFIEHFLSPDEEQELLNLLESETFTREGNRGVLQFGEYYKYMGSKTRPKSYPESIVRIMEKLNKDFGTKHRDSRYHYQVNSCLVNKYEGGSSDLPEHSDNEGDICPWSSIFTISIGSTRTMTFRNTQDNVETPVFCNGRSLYQMTRHSQDFYKHQIKADPGQENSRRYSLTFRAIHWSNFNSTLLVGDSNFGKIQFGVGKGKVGQATPGFRSFVPQVADIDPLACTSYKNIVVMAGTNDLKKNMTDEGILELYKTLKTKILQIRKYNPRCRLFVCPVLPTKSTVINKKIFMFNKYIVNDLLQCDLHVVLVEGFRDFVDNQTSLLKRVFAVNDPNDTLHVNANQGVRLLVRLIKQAIFRAKTYNKTVDGRTYANVTRGGPVAPI